jgi:hypothetical protein
VLDDHEEEFSIHKLDMNNDDPDVGCGSLENPLHFSEPPVLRIGPPTIRGVQARFAAVGSHIIATCPYGDNKTITFDTRTSTVDVSVVLPKDLETAQQFGGLGGYVTAIAARNRLYVFEECTDKNFDSGPYFPGCLHCLAKDPRGDEREWTWRPLSDNSQFSWSWTDCPPDFPFSAGSIGAHAVHPRTGTIFMSARGHVG